MYLRLTLRGEDVQDLPAAGAPAWPLHDTILPKLCSALHTNAAAGEGVVYCAIALQ